MTDPDGRGQAPPLRWRTGDAPVGDGLRTSRAGHRTTGRRGRRPLRCLTQVVRRREPPVGQGYACRQGHHIAAADTGAYRASWIPAADTDAARLVTGEGRGKPPACRFFADFLWASKESQPPEACPVKPGWCHIGGDGGGACLRVVEDADPYGVAVRWRATTGHRRHAP